MAQAQAEAPPSEGAPREGWVGDAVRFLTIYPNKRAFSADSNTYQTRIVTAPLISFSPETSLALGVGAKLLFKFKGAGPETRTSNMPINVRYTLRNQFVARSGYEIFFNRERYLLTGTVRFSIFPLLYYGIGRDTPESNEEEYTFTQYLFEPIFAKQVVRYLFVGGGLRYNIIDRVKFEEDSRLENSGLPGARGSTSAGVQLAVVYDSRDNILNASEGIFMSFTQGFYSKTMGGTQNFRLARLDFRAYTKPFKHRTDVLGFQLVGRISGGEVPVNELGILGGDEIMRGYYEGRYRDNHLVAFQAEYRRTLFRRWGGVVFAGMGDVAADVSDFSWRNLRPSVGAGLRFLIVAEERLNLRVDYGVGYKTNNFYLNIAESF